jgi:SAM-dependent methyltransferase
MGSGKSKNRRSRILAGVIQPIDKIVEIGALCNPVVRRGDGQVFYVDYAETDFLKERYKDDPNVNIEEIVDVDGVWGNNDLLSCLSGFDPVDLVIASHVIEHVPDMITWLQEIELILKPSGELSLAIPDMRFTFDHRRRLTDFSDLYESYILKRRRPSPLSTLDFSINFSGISARDAWRGHTPRRINISKGGLSEIKNSTLNNIEQGIYQDVHVSVFTPLRFAELMRTLSELDFLHYRCKAFIDTKLGGMEFFVRLQRCDGKKVCVESWNNVCHKLKSPFSQAKFQLPRLGALLRLSDGSNS